MGRMFIVRSAILGDNAVCQTPCLRYRRAMKSKNIPALTGLRFFAAMAIVFWHSQDGIFFNWGAFMPFDPAGAVPVFFALSGFVLTLGADRYKSWADFLVARIARVWPTHLAAILFLFVALYPYSMDYLRHPETLRQLFLNAFLLQAWSPNRATFWSYNAPSWSVSCEMFFYATFPITLATLRRHTLARLAIILGIILLALRAVDQIRPALDPVWLGADNPITTLSSFAIGVATGLWYLRAPHNILPKDSGTLIQLVALAAALGANAFLYSRIKPLTPGVYEFITNFGATPFYAALLFALARYDGVVSRALSHRIAVYGGEISYAIYLFHSLIIRWYEVHRNIFTGIPLWWQYAGIITACISVASIAHHLVEVPARRTILMSWGRLRTPPQGAAPAMEPTA
jgi:peptidoglycan/LPS O-acetylase OafA/YrhL